MAMTLDLKMWIKFTNMINPKTPLVNVQRLKTAATYSRKTETDEANTTPAPTTNSPQLQLYRYKVKTKTRKMSFKTANLQNLKQNWFRNETEFTTRPGQQKRSRTKTE